MARCAATSLLLSIPAALVSGRYRISGHGRPRLLRLKLEGESFKLQESRVGHECGVWGLSHRVHGRDDTWRLKKRSAGVARDGKEEAGSRSESDIGDNTAGLHSRLFPGPPVRYANLALCQLTDDLREDPAVAYGYIYPSSPVLPGLPLAAASPCERRHSG